MGFNDWLHLCVWEINLILQNKIPKENCCQRSSIVWGPCVQSEDVFNRECFGFGILQDPLLRKYCNSSREKMSVECENSSGTTDFSTRSVMSHSSTSFAEQMSSVFRETPWFFLEKRSIFCKHNLSWIFFKKLSKNRIKVWMFLKRNRENKKTLQMRSDMLDTLRPPSDNTPNQCIWKHNES